MVKGPDIHQTRTFAVHVIQGDTREENVGLSYCVILSQ